MKYIAEGFLKVDLYQTNGRYPLDYGDCYTLEDIKDMFDLSYKKGTKMVLLNDGTNEDPSYVWYIKKNLTVDGVLV